LDTTKVVLTKLRCSWWHGNKVAHGIASEVAEAKQGEADAFRVQLKCMPPEVREPMAEVTRKMNDLWKSKSLPFEDGGWRIMKVDKYDAVLQAVNELAAKRREIADYMVEHYEDILAYAKRALGAAYDEGMIPARDEMRRHFVTAFRCKPVPTAADVRLLNIGDEMRKEMEKQLTEQLDEATSLMKTEVRERLKHFITELLTRLNEHKDKSGARYGALLKSLGKYAQQFREIGLLDQDELLVKIEEIANTSSKDVREQPHIRKAVKKELEKVASAVESAFA